MGALYTDASARIMVPPVLWKAVLGDYMASVFDIGPTFGDWHDGESTGKQLEKQGTRAITARANIPFAEWVAQESNKSKDFLFKNPDTRKHWQAEAHKVRATVVCFCLRACVTAVVVVVPGRLHAAPQDAAARGNQAGTTRAGARLYHAHHAEGGHTCAARDSML